MAPEYLPASWSYPKPLHDTCEPNRFKNKSSCGGNTFGGKTQLEPSVCTFYMHADQNGTGTGPLIVLHPEQLPLFLRQSQARILPTTTQLQLVC
ncbi:hypothetical protein ATANTOWER_016382 [Ataeniobius toweri]|uniref:Uncharacterized protein n=1 Tax=Ataeniobius toweri TaxID=208326 RepID=A0ABU7AY70_9TELE|nr:hypothetical protein [Ataeniobius toweri]